MPNDDRTTPAHPWPEGIEQLTEEEARDAILFGQHTDKPSFQVDGSLLTLLETGSVVFARQPNGKLVMQASKAAVEGTDDVGQQTES